MKKSARVIAYYLPQFHPIPENDEWWGPGFTEWRNVAKAKPFFPGHYQPHIPGDLGFYDLRVPETRLAQAEMARQAGVEAFCYYHYWFAGEQLLERPFDEVLRSGEPDFPFCLCWANHSWTGIWFGAPDRVLKEQTYPGMKDHEEHFNWLLRAFSDDRYITVEGKPIFLVYHPMEVPDIVRVTDFWRELAVRAGLPGLYLIGVSKQHRWDPHEHGFDASVSERLPPLTRNVSDAYRSLQLKSKLLRKKLPTVYSYEEVLSRLVPREKPPYQDYPCVIPNWDNSPRSGLNGLILHDSTPELFRRQLKVALERVAPEAPSERIVFLKAWNEWAEGNYVEPDLKFGHDYLDVLKQELLGD